MELSFEDFDDGLRLIKLAGRMDVEGTEKIDLRFTSLSASKQSWIIVDLSEVNFISSLGLGTLVRSAAAQVLRKGKLVVLSPQSNVERVLKTTRISEIVAIYHDLADARRAVSSAAKATS